MAGFAGAVRAMAERVQPVLNLDKRQSVGRHPRSRVLSILIAGGSNFPVRQKEKQNRAADANMAEWQQIRGILDKIRGTGRGGISADDPEAVQKLKAKLAGLEQDQEKMKAVNAYYRKHKTLDGCPQLTPVEAEQRKAAMARSWQAAPKPYESYALTNNNAVMERPVNSKKNGFHLGYGWCGGPCRWGTKLKTRSLDGVALDADIHYVGIAADEPERLARLEAPKYLPLAEAGMTEADCLAFALVRTPSPCSYYYWSETLDWTK